MNKEEENIRNTVDYLMDNMDGERKKEFEERLSNDAELQETLKITQRTIGGIEGNSMNEKLLEFHRNFQMRRKSRRIAYSISGIAAALVILMGVWFLGERGQPKNDYYVYFEPFPNLLLVREGSYQGELATAFNQYAAGNYEAAAASFENITDIDTVRTDIMFYKAVSYLGAKQPEKAAVIFERLLQTKYEEQARWYGAICYLMMNQTDNAMEKLRAIEGGEYNYKRTQEVIDKLKAS